MPDDFDPYRTWLGIPLAEQPPTHYRLLGIGETEQDPKVIENAAERQMTYLRNLQTGSRGVLSQRLLNEVAQACNVLLSARERAVYDAQLGARRQGAQPLQPLLVQPLQPILVLDSAPAVALATQHSRAKAPKTGLVAKAAIGVGSAVVVLLLAWALGIPPFGRQAAPAPKVVQNIKPKQPAPPPRPAPEPRQSPPMVARPPPAVALAPAVPAPAVPAAAIPPVASTPSSVSAERLVTGSIIPGWGTIDDPEGDCTFVPKSGRLTILVPGTEHSIWPKFGKVNAPRVLQEVSGDFTVQVLVSSVSKGEAGTAIPGRKSKAAYHSGTLLIWKDPTTLVRFDRVDMHFNGSHVTRVNLQIFQDDNTLKEIYPNIPDKPTHLRLVRQGPLVTAGYSQDGGRSWKDLAPQLIELPQRVQAGVAVNNTTTQTNVVTFDDLRIVRTASN